MGKRGWIITVSVIFALAVITRFSLLSLRPLHHDEGVNFWFTNQIMSTGHFAYDPNNYHGPLFFFAIFLSFLVLGVSEFSLRLPAALFGLALVISPLLLRGRKDAWAIPAAGFLLLSPSLVYYSRYAIHEMALVFFSCVAVLLAIRILETRRLDLLPLLSVTMALLLATKETAILMLPILGLLAIVHWRRLWEAFSRPGSLEVVFLSAALFMLVYVMFYSSFFTYRRGVWDSFQGLMPWLSRGVQGAGHDKPWYYFANMLYQYELPLLLLGAAGLWYAWKSVAGRGIALWFIFSAVVYSVIDYKTPWLVINITAPLCILAAIGLTGLSSRWVKGFGFAASAGYLAVMALAFSFILPWQASNPYAYVHTDGDTLRLVRDIAEVAAGRKLSILVKSNEYWPLPFYLRDYAAEYFDPGTDAAAWSRFDAVVLKDTPDTTSMLPETGYQYRHYRLRDGVNLILAVPVHAGSS
ncbi:MAG: TIGR03663 family protein [Patescibacteria group bacterium]|nr:TIGR03663 family protein [Patescibacteria group bacterium]